MKPFALPLSLLLSVTAWTQTASPPAPAHTTDQITVTANRSASPVGDTAKTVSLLDSEELHDYPAVTLDESLRQHAGFELFRRASSRIANPNSEGISLRGLGSTAASRTLVLEDGAPLNDPFSSYIHWNENPQTAVRAVTLVTGGGSDLYGSSALGGVIDITPVTPAPARFDLQLTGGSQSTSNLAALVSSSNRIAGSLLAAESLRTAGYRLPDSGTAGPVDTPANVRSQSYRAELGRRDLEVKRVFLTGNLLNEDRANGTSLQTNGTRLWRYLAGYDAPEGPRATARIRVFGSQEGYRQSFSAIAANRSSESLTRLQRVHTQELGATADSTLHVRQLALVVGGDLRDLRASDNETPFVRGLSAGLQAVTARQRFLGAFGELLATHGSWSAAASLRGDRASNLDTLQTTRTSSGSVEVQRPNRSEIVLSPRLGLVRAFGPSASVHASAFRAFRTPSMSELYRTGQVGQEVTLSNPALLSERATGWEAGTELSNAPHRASLQATYFWTVINRPVSAVLVSQTANTITNQRENLGQIRSRGVEVEAKLGTGRLISETIGYQYAESTVTRFSAQPALVGNWIPQVPRHSFTAQLRAGDEHLGSLTLSARAIGRAYDDAGNQFTLGRFFSLDLSGQRELRHGLALFFLVQNLTNQRPQVARTPLLTLGSPIFAEGGVRFNLGAPPAP